ncbi:MAG: hypothetical protein RLZZ228_210, partial [Actinomycetota bacterium]
MSTVDVRCSTDLDRLLVRPLVYPGAGCVVPLGADAEDLSLHRSRRGVP